AVIYEFTRDRDGEHQRQILARYRGYLQADAYAAITPVSQQAGLSHGLLGACATRRLLAAEH
ncbi:MAG: transposase, partial [Lautropia sp.]